MKADPEDIRALAEDLKDVIDCHGDALEHNRDIADDLVKLKNKTEERYKRVAEK